MASFTPELPTYPVMGSPLGLGIVIVNKFQNVPSHYRRGADKETKNLASLFAALGLETRVYQELTSQEILEVMCKTARDPILKSHSIIAIAMSSHGNEEGLFGINIEERLQLLSEGGSTEGLNDVISSYTIQSIFNSHSCPMLQGKPKLLFLNGCRGGEKERHYAYEQDGTDPGAWEGTGSTEWSDFLVAWSAVDGYESLRHIRDGSVFISVLCEVMERYCGYSVELLLPVVNQKLIERTTRFCEKECRLVAECCVWMSTLKRQICLKSPKSTLSSRPSLEEAVEAEEDHSMDSISSLTLSYRSIRDSLPPSDSDPTTCVAICTVTFIDVTRDTPSKLKPGDKVHLLDSLDTRKNLMLIRRISIPEMGYVPRNVIMPDEDLSAESWYFEGMDRKKSDSMLTGCENGTFLVRSSIASPCSYRLAVAHQGKVHEYKINYLPFDWIYILSLYQFTSLRAMIAYLTSHKRVCCKLTHPYGKK